MGSIERLNYLINDSEATLARNALNHKLFNDTLLISIVPDSNFSNVSSVSFIYQKTQTDKIQRDYPDLSTISYSVHGEDLVTKVLLFSDTLSEQDKVLISNYYNDGEKQLEQNIVNFFTVGLANLITLCQLIQSSPNLFLPYNVSLPNNGFDVSFINQSYINYIDSFLFNIIQGKASNLVKTLATNVSNFSKLFSKIFVSGTPIDITKPVQEAMKDFQNHTYNPSEIISNHISVIERNKDDILNDIRTEAEFHKQEIRDLYLTKSDSCCDNIFSKQQDCLAEIDAAQERIDTTIAVFDKRSAAMILKMEQLLTQVDKRYNDIEDLYNQTQSLTSCVPSSCETGTVDEKLVSDLVNKYLSMQQKPDNGKLDSLSTRLDKESAKYKNSISRLEKMLEKILDSIEC